jgi:hypothetical protein
MISSYDDGTRRRRRRRRTISLVRRMKCFSLHSSR